MSLSFTTTGSANVPIRADVAPTLNPRDVFRFDWSLAPDSRIYGLSGEISRCVLWPGIGKTTFSRMDALGMD